MSVVRFGSPKGNHMHPDHWRGFDSLIDDGVRENRERFDNEVSPPAPTTYRKPTRIRLGRSRFRELWALVFLLAALFLAGLFNELRDLR
jgi:hypothetical protein